MHALLSCRGVLAMHFQRNLNAVLCSPVLFYIHIWENLQHTYTQHTQIYNTELKCRLLLRQPPLPPHQRGPKLQKNNMKNMKKCTPVLDQALPLQHTAKKNEKEPSSFEHHTRQNYNFLVCEEDTCKSQHQEPWSGS